MSSFQKVNEKGTCVNAVVFWRVKVVEVWTMKKDSEAGGVSVSNVGRSVLKVSQLPNHAGALKMRCKYAHSHFSRFAHLSGEMMPCRSASGTQSASWFSLKPCLSAPRDLAWGPLSSD